MKRTSSSTFGKQEKNKRYEGELYSIRYEEQTLFQSILLNSEMCLVNDIEIYKDNLDIFVIYFIDEDG